MASSPSLIIVRMYTPNSQSLERARSRGVLGQDKRIFFCSVLKRLDSMLAPGFMNSVYNAQTCFEYLSRTKRLLKVSNFLKKILVATLEQLLGVLTSNFSWIY